MKTREILGAIGLRNRARTYGHVVETFILAEDGEVRFAQWQHPKCARTVLEQPAINELRRYLSPGDAVIDVGAHSGDTSVLFALTVGPSGRVFAVEPNIYVLPVLEVNAGLNPSAAPIDILPYAATMEPAELTFNYSDPGYCNGGSLDRFGRFHGHFYPLNVEGRNILSELKASAPGWLPKVRMIKIDTEGNDATVVESLRSLIEAESPCIVSEIFWRVQTKARMEYLRTIEAMGYEIYRAELWTNLRAERITPEDASRWNHFDIFCVPKGL